MTVMLMSRFKNWYSFWVICLYTWCNSILLALSLSAFCFSWTNLYILMICNLSYWSRLSCMLALQGSQLQWSGFTLQAGLGFISLLKYWRACCGDKFLGRSESLPTLGEKCLSIIFTAMLSMMLAFCSSRTAWPGGSWCARHSAGCGDWLELCQRNIKHVQCCLTLA